MIGLSSTCYSCGGGEWVLDTSLTFSIFTTFRESIKLKLIYQSMVGLRPTRLRKLILKAKSKPKLKSFYKQCEVSVGRGELSRYFTLLNLF